ncbi:hypothetical protein UFOVP245_106 [uncultured Caudovirales phage]|uniref:Uncharacterized protein n=1 Tax=uncultured Caudovirales phage TaxID=2100421 RepID=A0A6J7X1S7_9CAUD|nr:hypothetical protein UFOVP245_106 [uncultured Caudovirales phage]
MPVTNISLLRSPSSQAGPTTQPAVGVLPNYAILFWYAPIGRWDALNFGGLNTGYFRTYTDICYPKAQFIDALTGTATSLKSNPLIRCIDIDTDWKTKLDVCYAATIVTSDKYSTRLETGGKHSPTDTKVFSRSGQPLGFGKAIADAASTTVKYFPLTTAHSGHDHSVPSCIDALKNVGWGELYPGLTAAAGAEDYQGTQHVAVNLVIRDPSLQGGSTAINSLPKNVIVFGANLPSPDYVNTDDKGGSTIGHRLSATGISAPLLAKTIDVGLIGNAGVLTFRATSNNNGTHTHADIKNTQLAASDKTGQTAYVFNTSAGTIPTTTSPGAGFGDHNHQIEYHNTVTIKSKELRAYITALDQTPIADGVIIGYSIGKFSGYKGTENGPSALPAGWYFCDGTNGTPDLRGYFINANFRDSAHDVELSPTSSTAVSDIVVNLAGAHGHAGPPNLDYNFPGTDQIKTGLGSAVDIGAHGFDKVTEHTHTISTQSSFILGGVTYKNYKVGVNLNYTPPAVDIAFIQYKAP